MSASGSTPYSSRCGMKVSTPSDRLASIEASRVTTHEGAGAGPAYGWPAPCRSHSGHGYSRSCVDGCISR